MNFPSSLYRDADVRIFVSDPVYDGIERSFPDDSKNVSFVNMGLECMILTIPQLEKGSKKK